MARSSVILLCILIAQLIAHFPVDCKTPWPKNVKLLKRMSCGKRIFKNYTTISITDPKLGIDCTYKITPYSSNVHQLLIKFNFNLTEPTGLADSGRRPNSSFVPKCEMDYLEIAGKRFCGTEESQHFYVPFNYSSRSKSIKIRFVVAPRYFVSGLSKGRYLSATIEQLEMESVCSNRGCPENDERLAPAICSQYFTEEEGSIASFNYRNGKGMYPAGLDYNICIRHPPGAWALRMDFLDFNLRISSSCRSRQRPNKCLGRYSDQLSIPWSVVEPFTANDFLNVLPQNDFCGDTIRNKTIISEDNNNEDTFFLIHFESNVFTPRKTEAGFLIKYTVLYEEDASDLYENQV